MAKSAPKKPMLQKYGETEFGQYGYNLGRKGYKGLEENADRVNVFYPETQRSLDAQANNVYSRALGDFDRNYRNTIGRMQDRNYSQFGTLNATSPAYTTDLENLSQQRKLADLEYNKAMYRDSLTDSELNRRYNTMNMYNNLYNKGDVVGQSDWQTENVNRDRAWSNDVSDWNTSQKGKKIAGNAISSVLAAIATVYGGPAAGMAVQKLGNMATDAIVPSEVDTGTSLERDTGINWGLMSQTGDLIPSAQSKNSQSYNTINNSNIIPNLLNQLGSNNYPLYGDYLRNEISNQSGGYYDIPVMNFM